MQFLSKTLHSQWFLVILLFPAPVKTQQWALKPLRSLVALQCWRQEGPMMFSAQSTLRTLASVLPLPACMPLQESQWDHGLEDEVSTIQTLSRLYFLDFQWPLGPWLADSCCPSPSQVLEMTSCYYFSSCSHFYQNPVTKDGPGGAVDKQHVLIPDFLLGTQAPFFFLADDRDGRKLGYNF
jgi:hypothetical protein